MANLLANRGSATKKATHYRCRIVTSVSAEFDSGGALSGLVPHNVGLGYVFQHSQLLPFLSVNENLTVVGKNARIPAKELAGRVRKLAFDLGIDGLLHQNSESLSGGERHRVAVARALLHHPQLILADEPTGALDAEQGRCVARILTDQARRQGAALIVVPHDVRIIEFFDRTLRIESGRLSQ